MRFNIGAIALLWVLWVAEIRDVYFIIKDGPADFILFCIVFDFLTFKLDLGGFTLILLSLDL